MVDVQLVETVSHAADVLVFRVSVGTSLRRALATAALGAEFEVGGLEVVLHAAGVFVEGGGGIIVSGHRRMAG